MRRPTPPHFTNTATPGEWIPGARHGLPVKQDVSTEEAIRRIVQLEMGHEGRFGRLTIAFNHRKSLP